MIPRRPEVNDRYVDGMYTSLMTVHVALDLMHACGSLHNCNGYIGIVSPVSVALIVQKRCACVCVVVYVCYVCMYQSPDLHT